MQTEKVSIMVWLTDVSFFVCVCVLIYFIYMVVLCSFTKSNLICFDLQLFIKEILYILSYLLTEPDPGFRAPIPMPAPCHTAAQEQFTEITMFCFILK